MHWPGPGAGLVFQDRGQVVLAEAGVDRGVSEGPVDLGGADELGSGDRGSHFHPHPDCAGGCGLGALSAAEDEGVWGVGVDRDQSDLGPHILTSAVKRVDTSVFDTIQAVQDGTFKGGEDATFNLANDGVALGTTSDEVPQELLDELDALKQQIIDGEVTVPDEL